MKTRLGLLLFPLCLCVGCASSAYRVDTDQDTEVTVSYDWRDLDQAMAELTQSLQGSTALGGTSARPLVVTIGRVTNDSCQHLDADLLTGRLEAALTETGRFEITAAMADSASRRDAMIAEARTARGNTEFDQSSVQQKGQLKAPDLSLSGKLTQRNVRRDNGGLRVEYALLLKATRLQDGVVVWQKTVQTVKSVADGMPVW